MLAKRSVELKKLISRTPEALDNQDMEKVKAFPVSREDEEESPKFLKQTDLSIDPS